MPLTNKDIQVLIDNELLDLKLDKDLSKNQRSAIMSRLVNAHNKLTRTEVYAHNTGRKYGDNPGVDLRLKLQMPVFK